MKILGVESLIFPEVKLIRYGRFQDHRGFFTETYKKSDFDSNPGLSFLKGKDFKQMNISYSKKGVIRGLHFQWNPPMIKLVRVVDGRMVDFFLDIRKNSPTFGKIGAFNMSSHLDDETNAWIFIPKGFAHGGCYLEDTIIEYLCDSEWSPKTEASISPLAKDIDWSLCDSSLKKIFDQVASRDLIISEKDKNGLTIEEWKNSPNSENLIYS